VHRGADQVTDWIHISAAPEHAPRIVYRSAQRDERVADLILTASVPRRALKPPAALLLDGDRILETMRLLEVVRAAWINERPYFGHRVSRPDLRSAQHTAAGAMNDGRCELILIEDQHRHESVAAVRECDRHLAPHPDRRPLTNTACLDSVGRLSATRSA
jgi:hypothetical protein